LVGIYRNLVASLMEILAKSMERRTRYHLVFDKIQRNELRNLFAGTHGILLEEKQSSYSTVRSGEISNINNDINLMNSHELLARGCGYLRSRLGFNPYKPPFIPPYEEGQYMGIIEQDRGSRK